MSVPTTSTTRVAIVGGGPAGLMLSHLLHVAGIESVVLERRGRRENEITHRAGILERYSVRLFVDSGVSDRVLRDGDRHGGIYPCASTGRATTSTSTPSPARARGFTPRPTGSPTSPTRGTATAATCASG